MIVNILYYAALACIAAVCVRQNRIRFRYGHKFHALVDDYESCPDMTYARLYRFCPKIGITASNFDKPVRFFLIVPSETVNRREVLKLFFLAEQLKLGGMCYEVVVSADPALKPSARLIFEKNKYRMQSFDSAQRKIFWKYPRFLTISGNDPLCEAFRRVRRCILNFYHRNKYEDDMFYRLVFDFFQADRDTFVRNLQAVLADSFDAPCRESEGLLIPFSDDEQGVFFATVLYHVSVLHVDLFGEEGECVAAVGGGRLRTVLTRRKDSLGNIFFPLLYTYFARAEESDLKSFNFLCALPFKKYFDHESVSFQKRITDENLLFLLGFSKLGAEEGIESFCARAEFLRHNQPEQEDFFTALTLYLVLVSKILKLNVSEGRLFFGTPREALPLSVSCFEREIEFLATDDFCVNNSVPLRSKGEKFTIFVN